MLRVSVLSPDDAPAYGDLAFPRYRPLLLANLGPSGTTLAVGAALLGRPCGLALAGPLGGETTVVLHSVAVAAETRRQGVATQLLEELEAALGSRGVQRVLAPYRGDRPQNEALTKLFERRGFERYRSVVELTYPVRRLLEAPALNLVCPGAAVVDPGTEVPDALLNSRDTTGFAPAQVPAVSNDPAFATVVTLDGEAAACAFGHRIAPDTVHMSLLFVLPDLRRGGLAGFTTRAFLLRLLDLGVSRLACEVEIDNAACLPLADGKVGAYADHRALVHHMRKAL